MFGACFLAYLYASIGGPVILRLARRVRLQVRLLGDLAVPQDALGRHHLVLNLEAWSMIEVCVTTGLVERPWERYLAARMPWVCDLFPDSGRRRCRMKADPETFGSPHGRARPEATPSGL